MSPKTQERSAAAAGREVTISRTIAAPPAAVFAAWTEPDQIKKWFAPKDFTTPVAEVELKEGGAHRIVMRSKEGMDYPITGVYHEMSRPTRLVMTQNMDEHPPEWHEQVRAAGGSLTTDPVLTVTFDERGGKTLLTLRTRFATPADRQAMASLGMADGWNETLDRLQSVVEGAASSAGA